MTTNSRKDCIGTDSDMNSDDPGVSTDPLENGYVVGGLSKGDICFLRGTEIDNVGDILVAEVGTTERVRAATKRYISRHHVRVQHVTV